MKLIQALLYSAVFIFLPGIAGSQQKTNPMVESIAFIGEKSGVEIIHFHLTEKLEPKVFELSGENPRAVFDFVETGYPAKNKKVVSTGGKYIKKIRIGLHNEPVSKIRVVLDLAKGHEYTINQKYLSAEKVLEVGIAPKKIAIVEKAAAEPAQSKSKTGGPPGEKEAERVEQTASFPPVNLSDSTNIAQTDDADSKRQDTAKKTDEPSPPMKQPSRDPEPRSAQIFSAVDDTIHREASQESHILLDVTFERTMGGKEMILFKLNGFYPPVVFAIDNENLRVVCDFLDAELDAAIDETIETDGDYIRRVRVAKHSDPDKVRVVLDLAAEKNYDLKQIFFKEDNLFVVSISNIGDK